MDAAIVKLWWIGVFLSACASPATSSGEGCLQSIPMDAGVNLNHGQFFFVAPKGIPNAYSGAQEMWSENGQLVWRLEFHLGQVVRLQMFEAVEGSLTCDYSKAAEVLHEDCPARQQLSSGLPTIQFGSEPTIPPERDLRGKCVVPAKLRSELRKTART